MMAIAYDTGVAGTNSGVGTTLTLSHTCTGSNLLLLFWLWKNNAATDTMTGVTYNGVAMTQSTNVKYSTANERLYLYYLAAPATGTHDIVATDGVTSELWCASASYTGAKQTGIPDATPVSAQTAGTSFNASVTPVASNCWVVSGCGGQRNGTASTNLTGRAGNVTQGAAADSNGTVTAGSPYSGTWTVSGSLRQLMLITSIAPSIAAGPTNMKSYDGNLIANIKSMDGNLIANVKSFDGNS